ncbi:glycosyltransferase family 2 protein [Cyanobacteria bacterium FACHB-63]|nr:glycosyltransferase family 2 protein [Cyanobacteria bacterium FACHB-63]
MTSIAQVTIAIPTYNRSDLLKISLKSVLEQDYTDFQVIVLDNASTDDTEAVVHSFADSRITYVRNETNIGIFRNFARAIELNSSPYLTTLPDDDTLLPGFLRQSVLALDNHPLAAFSVAGAKGIDSKGMSVPLPNDPPPEGLITGLDYLHEIVAGRNWVLYVPSVMYRAEALSAVGAFDPVHSNHSTDLNLYLRLAAHHNIVFIPEVLSQVRIHTERDSYTRFASGGTGPLATMAERTDAIAYLLESPRAADASYRQWLSERLLHISMRRSELTAQLVPQLNLSWSERLQVALQDLTSITASGKQFILIDENQWGCEKRPDFQVLPFLEQAGEYWGAPLDSQTAIRELERMRHEGASFLVIGWTAFWWFDYFAEFRDHLNTNFPCILRNSCLMVFNLEHPLHL